MQGCQFVYVISALNHLDREVPIYSGYWKRLALAALKSWDSQNIKGLKLYRVSRRVFDGHVRDLATIREFLELIK